MSGTVSRDKHKYNLRIFRNAERESGSNSALTDVVLVGMRCVCDKYIWHFTD